MLRKLACVGMACGGAAFSVTPAAVPTLRSASVACGPHAVQSLTGGIARAFTASTTVLKAKGRDSSVESGDIGGYFTGGGGYNEIDDDDDEDIPLSVKMDALRRMQEFSAIEKGQTLLQSGQMRATNFALEVTVEELKEALRKKKNAEQDVFLLDCREADEFSFCKVEGAVLIPLSEMQERYDEVPKDKPVYVICHHGMRSMQAIGFVDLHFRQKINCHA